MGVNNIPSTLV